MNSSNYIPYNKIMEEGRAEFSNLCSPHNNFKEACYDSKIFFAVKKFIKDDLILNKIPEGRIFNSISAASFYTLNKEYVQVPNRLISKKGQLNRKQINHLMLFGQKLGLWSIKYNKDGMIYKINLNFVRNDSLLLAYQNTTTKTQEKVCEKCKNTGNQAYYWFKYKNQAVMKERRRTVLAYILAYRELTGLDLNSLFLKDGTAPREDIEYAWIPLELLAETFACSVGEISIYIRNMSKHVDWIKPHNLVYIDGKEEHYLNPEYYRECPLIKYIKAEKEPGHPDVNVHTYILFKENLENCNEYKHYLKHKEDYMLKIKETIYKRHIKIEKSRNDYIQKNGTEEGFKTTIYNDNSSEYMDRLNKKVVADIELDANLYGYLSNSLYQYEEEDFINSKKMTEMINRAKLEMDSEFMDYDNPKKLKENKKFAKAIAANNWKMEQCKASQVMELFQNQGGANIIDLEKIHGEVNNIRRISIYNTKKISSDLPSKVLRGMLKGTIDSIENCTKNQLNNLIYQFTIIFDRISKKFNQLQDENNVKEIELFYQFFYRLKEGNYKQLIYKLEQNYKDYKKEKEFNRVHEHMFFKSKQRKFENLLEKLYEKITKSRFECFKNYNIDYNNIDYKIEELENGFKNTDYDLLYTLWSKYNYLFNRTETYDIGCEII